MFKKLYLLLILSTTAVSALAQSLDVNFNGFGFLDNREYKAFIPRSRTYSGTRLALDIGLNLDSVNRFVVGANGIHEFGGKPYFLKVDPVAYYNYHAKQWQFYAGMFPREGLLTDYPRSLLNDTLRYYRPNVEGLLTRFTNEHFTETVWLDWVSRQTASDREQFIFGFSGKYKPAVNGIFYVSHYFMLLHDAGAEIPDPNYPLGDNGAGQIRLGLNLTGKTSLDSLSIEAGGMMSFERRQRISGFKTPAGFVAAAHLKYKRFELHDEFYAGQGHHVIYGDSYYLKKIYNRLDIIYTPFLFKNIKGQFIFSFHQSPAHLNDNQQAFRIVADLGRKTLVKFKN
ncbi:hypothetical protein DJ568_10935 [Mucilaginibacter hurinus]|uniref:Porin n=1 Tax=Mucilaginibacter hurinus TaxID=2201324 RepID=A0A367GQL4_9SPHI|nr:hypothetical protein [Mucilaginibacter hurinus]RCH54981.1 hypothetical protein DJ568_10935 [Mucilaginibacter hurinus]